MKGEIEEQVKELDFDHTIIVRPGLIVYHRAEKSYVETILQGSVKGLGKVHSTLKDTWAQDADVFAKAAVAAAIKVEKGEVKDKLRVLGPGSERYHPAWSEGVEGLTMMILNLPSNSRAPVCIQLGE